MNRFIIDSTARSWAPVPEGSDFPIQNLPIGVFRTDSGEPRPGIAIGARVLDLAELAEVGLMDPGEVAVASPALNGLGVEGFRSMRRNAFELLREGSEHAERLRSEQDRFLVPMERVSMQVPFEIGAFVDFYSSANHASNVGKMFRPQGEPLLPNWKHLPVGYNGRASTVAPSGQTIVRPSGQTKPPDTASPVFGPTKELDFELEMGFFLGADSQWGKPVPIERCEEMIFGLVLVNDWSARDVQRWEYQPLGPFLAKSFATSISPWVVSMDALEPWRVAGPIQEPEPLPNLRSPGPGAFDIHLEVTLQTARMSRPQSICHTNFKELYWSMAQQLAHQTSNGALVQAGDLYASGTISGPSQGSFGSLLELAWKGERPLELRETGETRTFLEDGDMLTFTGWCERSGYRIGFGECSGTIGPSWSA